MKKSDKLFQLIKSLSTSEKRIVKTSLESNAVENKRMLLFRLISDSKNDETKILTTLYGPTSKQKSAYSQLKKFLFDHICEVLVSWDNKSSIQRKIEYQIHVAEALFKRGLYPECQETLYKQDQEANKIQAYDLAIKIWQKRVSWALLVNDVDLLDRIHNDFLVIWKKNTSIIQLEHENWLEYTALLSNFKRTNQVPGDQKTDFVDNGHNSHLSQIHQLQVEGMLAFSHQDYITFRSRFDKAKEILEKHSILTREYPELYLELQSRSIYGAFACRDYVQTLTRLEKYKESIFSSTTSKLLKSIYLENYYLYQLVVCNTSGKFDEGVKIISEILKDLPEFHNGQYAVTALNLYISLYFVSGNLEKAQEWIMYLNNFLNRNKTERQDLQKALRWIELFLHIEMGNTQILESLIRSITRERKKDPNYKPTIMEKAIHKLVKNILVNTMKEPEAFKIFFDEVENALSNPKERFIQNYFHILSWAESHINGSSFAYAATQRLGRLKPLIVEN